MRQDKPSISKNAHRGCTKTDSRPLRVRVGFAGILGNDHDTTGLALRLVPQTADCKPAVVIPPGPAHARSTEGALLTRDSPADVAVIELRTVNNDQPTA